MADFFLLTTNLARPISRAEIAIPSLQVRRVLKPGGRAIISQSNRCFPSKAITMWLNMDDRQHLELINGYAKYAGFGPGKAFDITASVPDDPNNNPMFIVEVTK